MNVNLIRVNPTHLTHLRFAEMYNANISFWPLGWGKTPRRARPRRWRKSRIVEEASTEFWLSYWVKHEIWRESESERKGLRLYIETNAQWRATKRTACTQHMSRGSISRFLQCFASRMQLLSHCTLPREVPLCMWEVFYTSFVLFPHLSDRGKSFTHNRLKCPYDTSR